MSNSSKIRIINNTGFPITLDVVLKSTKAWKKGYSPLDVLNNETIQDEEQRTVLVAYENSSNADYYLHFYNVKKDKSFRTGMINQNDAKKNHMQNYKLNNESGDKKVMVSCTIITTPYAEEPNQYSIPIMNIYLNEPRKTQEEREESDELSFYVFSDPHFSQDDKKTDYKSNVQIQYRLRDHLMAQKGYWQADYVFITGDLSNVAKTHEGKLYTDTWFPDLCNLDEYHPILCDGYGNHDMESNFGQFLDMAGLIKDHNIKRKEAIRNKSFVTNTLGDPGLHYTWKAVRRTQKERKEHLIHFFMLNLLPTSGCDDNREHNSNCALDFLKSELSKISFEDPIFLFHHYGFFLPDTETPNRWWTQQQMEIYLDCLKKHTVAGIFYGHLHYNENGNNKTMHMGDIQSFMCGGGRHGEYVSVRAKILDGDFMKVRCATYVVGKTANDTKTIENIIKYNREIDDESKAAPYNVYYKGKLPDMGDYTDFYDAARGFCKELSEPIIKYTSGNKETVIWETDRYRKLLGSPLRNKYEEIGSKYYDPRHGECPSFDNTIADQMRFAKDGVNPSLWRQALLNNMHGLYKVKDGIYQVRGYDLANMTIVETDCGIVVIDCTTTEETAIAALRLYRDFSYNKKPVQAIILTHTHVDHYGGIQGVIKESMCPKDQAPLIIAPENFLEEAALENALVGDAMTRRSTYQYGTFLNVLEDGTGKVDAGLGKDIQIGGTVTIASPDCVVVPNKEDEKVQTDGRSGYLYERLPYAVNLNDSVKFEFMLCPNTEAPAEMTVWIDKYKTLVAAEMATHTLHNLLTPRGAEVRDARLWWKALDKLAALYGDEAVCICATHHWPIWKDKDSKVNRCRLFLEQQRDCYKYLHDQTVRLINKGYTMLEIAAWFDQPDNLPEFMKNQWHNRGYYGTISHDVRAIYQKYLGWYDMNPSNLNPLPQKDTAKRYINMIGRINVNNAINDIAKNENASHEDLRWAAELGKHLVLSGCGDKAEQLNYRSLLASVYERLGFACEAGTWRNMYLVGAEELRKGGPIHAMPGGSANVSILCAMDIELFYDFVASRLSADNAKGIKKALILAIYEKPEESDAGVKALHDTLEEGYCITIENMVMNFHKITDPKSIENVIHITRSDFAKLILGLEYFDDLKDNITIYGNANNVKDFFKMFEKIDINFNIVLPK